MASPSLATFFVRQISPRNFRVPRVIKISSRSDDGCVRINSVANTFATPLTSHLSRIVRHRRPLFLVCIFFQASDPPRHCPQLSHSPVIVVSSSFLHVRFNSPSLPRRFGPSGRKEGRKEGGIIQGFFRHKVISTHQEEQQPALPPPPPSIFLPSLPLNATSCIPLLLPLLFPLPASAK